MSLFSNVIFILFMFLHLLRKSLNTPEEKQLYSAPKTQLVHCLNHEKALGGTSDAHDVPEVITLRGFYK